MEAEADEDADEEEGAEDVAREGPVFGGDEAGVEGFAAGMEDHCVVIMQKKDRREMLGAPGCCDGHSVQTTGLAEASTCCETLASPGSRDYIAGMRAARSKRCRQFGQIEHDLDHCKAWVCHMSNIPHIPP